MKYLKNSEYDQEIPQSQTADTPGTERKSQTTITRHQEDKLSKATSFKPAVLRLTEISCWSHVESLLVYLTIVAAAANNN